jgi:AcrR family transcriptional regulator
MHTQAAAADGVVGARRGIGVGQREDAKAERRRRIVAATRDLIRETGDAGLSMRAIAARAKVALTTPYSLFGSKRAIVIAVLEDVREFQERFAGLPRNDPIDRIFAALGLSLGYYAEDPDFYRILWSEALNLSGKELRSELSTPQRTAFWWSLLEDAQRGGALHVEIDLDLLLRTLDLVFGATMLAWVLGGLSVDDLEASVGFGYALVLRGAANPDAQAGMATRIEAYQQQLVRSRQQARAA